jgi:hypothetical protein
MIKELWLQSTSDKSDYRYKRDGNNVTTSSSSQDETIHH